MNLKKSGLFISILLLVSLLVVSCTSSRGTDTISLKGILDKIIEIGKLEFLGLSGESAITGFMRVMVFILVFAILFEASKFVLPATSRGLGITISIIIALISCIFMPGAILIAIGSSYAIVVSLFLIGSVVVGGFFAIFQIPTHPWYWHVVRISILILLLWILYVMKGYAEDIAFIGGIH